MKTVTTYQFPQTQIQTVNPIVFVSMKSKYAYPEHNYHYNACQKLDGFITICTPYIKTMSTKKSI